MTDEANAPETMKVEWTQTVEDMAAFGARSLDKSSTARRNLWIGWFGWPVLIIFLVLGSLWDQLLKDPAGLLEKRFPWFLFLSVILLYWLFTYPRRVKRRRQNVLEGMYGEKGNEHLFGYRSLTVTSDALLVEAQYIKSTFRWKAINGIKMGDDYVDIHIAPLEAITIPRSAFQTGDEFQAFVELARKYHAAATGQSAAGA